MYGDIFILMILLLVGIVGFIFMATILIIMHNVFSSILFDDYNQYDTIEKDENK